MIRLGMEAQLDAVRERYFSTWIYLPRKISLRMCRLVLRPPGCDDRHLDYFNNKYSRCVNLILCAARIWCFRVAPASNITRLMATVG